MSKKKARLIGCNDWNYYQYYNTYLTKGVIVGTNLRHDQNKLYIRTRIKNTLLLSKKNKFIISGTR